MSLAFPGTLAYGRIRGQFIRALMDGSDPDLTPDPVPAQGTITFKPVLTQATTYDDAEGVAVIPDSITVTLDVNGCMKGEAGEYFVATDRGNPVNWRYLVSFNIVGLNITPFPIDMPAGSDRFITELLPVAANPGGTVILRGPKGDKGADGPEGPPAEIPDDLTLNSLHSAYIYGEEIVAGGGGVTSGAAMKAQGVGEFRSADASSPTLLARMAPAQTADAQVWNNSAGTPVASLSAIGDINANAVTAVGSINAGGNINAFHADIANGVDVSGYSYFRNNLYVDNASLSVQKNDGQPGIDFRGPASGGQQVSGRMEMSYGNSAFNFLSADRSAYIGLLAGTIYATRGLDVTAYGPTSVGISFNSVPGQNADMQQWRNSAGTALAAVASDGLVQGKGGVEARSPYGGSRAAFRAFNSGGGDTGGVVRVFEGYSQDGSQVTSWISVGGNIGIGGVGSVDRNVRIDFFGGESDPHARVYGKSFRLYTPGAFLGLVSPDGSKGVDVGLRNDGTVALPANPTAPGWNSGSDVMLGNVAPNGTQRTALLSSGRLRVAVMESNGRAGHGAVVPFEVYHDGDDNPSGNLIEAKVGGSTKFEVSKAGVAKLNGKKVSTNPIVQMTQAAYDALATKDADTLYVIVG